MAYRLQLSPAIIISAGHICTCKLQYWQMPAAERQLMLKHRAQGMALMLQAAVRVSPGPGPARTVVFAADVAAADSAASVLRDAGLQPLVYHRKLPAEQRATALTAMAQRCASWCWQ